MNCLRIIWFFETTLVDEDISVITFILELFKKNNIKCDIVSLIDKSLIAERQKGLQCLTSVGVRTFTFSKNIVDLPKDITSKSPDEHALVAVSSNHQDFKLTTEALTMYTGKNGNKSKVADYTGMNTFSVITKLLMWANQK